MISALGRPSPRSASAGTTSCTNDTSSTRWNSSFRSTGNWDRSIDARRTIPGKRLPGRIRRSSSRPSGDRSEYPQFEHRSMLLWEYVVEFPTLRARGGVQRDIISERRRPCVGCGGFLERLYEQRVGDLVDGTRLHRRLGRHLSSGEGERRLVVPCFLYQRVDVLSESLSSEFPSQVDQLISHGLVIPFRRVGETWSSVTAPATQGAASSCRIAARRFVAPPDGYEQQSGGGREVGYHLPASPHVDERGGNSRLQPRPYWALRRVRSDALHRVGGCFGVDVASDLRSLRFATDPPPLQVLPSHRDATAAERDDQRPHDHG